MIAGWEMVTLAFLAVLVFGPERLPGMARTAARMIGRLRAEASSTMDEIKRASDYDEIKSSVGVDEMRELRNELRSGAAVLGGEAEMLRRQARLSDDATGMPDVPAPFDPDAT